MSQKYAVAYIHQHIPSFDRMEFDGESYRYYMGGTEVARIWKPGMPLFGLHTHLDVCFIEAKDEMEAIDILTSTHPYHIVRAVATRIPEPVCEEQDKL